jgi:hypothetical protein
VGVEHDHDRRFAALLAGTTVGDARRHECFPAVDYGEPQVTDSVLPAEHLAVAAEASQQDALTQGGTEKWAICCSGGGIRSASYCLGALQWLEEAKFLDKARLILGVSGGSYISASRALVARGLELARDMAGPPAYAPGSPEEEHLRDNTRYLVPDAKTLLARPVSVQRRMRDHAGSSRWATTPSTCEAVLPSGTSARFSDRRRTIAATARRSCGSRFANWSSRVAEDTSPVSDMVPPSVRWLRQPRERDACAPIQPPSWHRLSPCDMPLSKPTDVASAR